MTVTDELVQNAERYAEDFDRGDLPLPPARKVAIVACMDARLDPYALLGLTEGDAHVIRNAGGAVTDDAIRSLAISQRLLGTEAIVLIHHTDCGMLTFGDEEFRGAVESETGIRPPWAAESLQRPRRRRPPVDRADQGLARSSRAATTCAASSTTSRRGRCARSDEPLRVVDVNADTSRMGTGPECGNSRSHSWRRRCSPPPPPRPLPRPPASRSRFPARS